MEQKVLKIELRSRTGKGISRQLRRQGLVPAVVYGKGIDAVPVSLNPKELAEAIAGEGRNRLMALQGGGSLDGSLVLVAEILHGALKREIMHVDLHRINLTEKVRVKVPVNLVGTAAGVKEGGLLDFAMHEVEVECLPTQIPGRLDVDVTGLAIGHSFHVSDLQLPAGVKVLEDAKANVVCVLGRAREEAAAGESA